MGAFHIVFGAGNDSPSRWPRNISVAVCASPSTTPMYHAEVSGLWVSRRLTSGLW
jgi:hypothetical protein